MNFRHLLAARFPLSEAQLDQLERHYALLEKWNRKMNLIRTGSLDELVELHYCESLFLGQALPPGMLRIADVGSGAGFPGIPVAVLRLESSITLIESHRRKAVFLSESSLGLSNVQVICSRAQELPGRYDWVVARAVRGIDVLDLRLSANLGLLTTETELRGLPEPSTVLKSPWGNQRVVAMFHVEHDRIDQRG